MAMPRRARAGGSLRSAMRLRAPRGSPTANARAAEATRESTSGRIPSIRGAARGDRADSSVLSCAASASDHVPEANPTSSSHTGMRVPPERNTSSQREEVGMTTAGALGFVGLGVMGEAMCRNLAKKSGATVVAFDEKPAPLAALAGDGVQAVVSLAEVARRAEIIFLCLPGEPQVRAVCLGGPVGAGLATLVQQGQTVVDMSTCPVALTRELQQAFAARGAAFADAPIARTAQAARDGTLSIMVGSDPAVFARLRPLLGCMGSEVTHCGGVGAGQAVKLMNNMVVAQTVVALAEALAVARASGAVDPHMLFETLVKGSADSFVLRNHGMKSL